MNLRKRRCDNGE